MNKELALILEYQEADKKLKKIEDELYKTEEYENYSSSRKFLSTLQENLISIDAKAEKCLNSYNATLEQIKVLNKELTESIKTLEDCNNEDELSYYSKRFKHKSEEISKMEEMFNSIVKEMEELNKEFYNLGRKNKEMRAVYEKNKPLYEKLLNDKKEEIANIKDARNKLEKQINPEFIEKYKSKKKDKKFPVVFEVDLSGKQVYCPLCGNAVSIYARGELEEGNIKECDNCKRFLYSK